MEASAPRVELLGISKAFPGVQGLENVDFRLNAGEVHALLGENGAGKSTLIKIMTGAVTATAGKMLLDGEPVEFATPGRGPRAGHQHGLSGSESHPDDVGDQEFDARAPAAALRTSFHGGKRTSARANGSSA